MRTLLVNTVLAVLLAARQVYCQDTGVVRLVNGASSHEGRVEVFAFGVWGTVCDDGFDINEANVICRMLGYPDALNSYSRAYFGQGRGRIVMDELHCAGDERSLFDCPINVTIGTHDCSHREDAGVECNNYPDLHGTPLTLPVRLTCPYGQPCNNQVTKRGPDPGECSRSMHVEGIVQVFYNDTWWYISSDGWDGDDVNVVCGQLGYPAAFGSASRNSLLPRGTKIAKHIKKKFNRDMHTVLMKGVNCDGTEGKLDECSRQEFGLLHSDHVRVAVARCGFDQHSSCAKKCQQVSE